MHHRSLRAGIPAARARIIQRALAAVIFLSLLGVVAAPARAINCFTEKMRTEAPRFAPPPTGGLQQPHPLYGPPPHPKVGDQWAWWLWYFAGGPPHALSKTCTVRGMGKTCYVMVNNDDWNVWVHQSDVDKIVANWDSTSYGQWANEGIYQLDTSNFGPPPDIDHDSRIYVMLYDWDVTGADGYFNSQDEDTTYAFSNKCEVIYVDASTPQPGGPSGAYLTAVMAHEFTHMIQWEADPYEVSWVDEGQAELAMWFYGHPDPIQYSGFDSNPDNNLTTFGGSSADYIKSYMFCLYFYEHHGGQPGLRAWVANTQTSLAGVASTLQEEGDTTTVPELVRDWTTANYVNSPTIDGGKYYYSGENIPPFAAVTKSTYPVSPVNTTLNHWAGEYVKFTNGQPQQLNFDGGDGVSWYARVVKYVSGVPQSVEDIPLDPGTQAGSFPLPGFGTQYDQVVMTVADVSNSGTTGYQYSTTNLPSGVPPVLASAGPRLLDAGSNPFSREASLRLDLGSAARIEATVEDVRGARVRSLALGSMEAGSHLLHWDGRNDAGQPVPDGVYFVRVGVNGGKELTHRLVRIR